MEYFYVIYWSNPDSLNFRLEAHSFIIQNVSVLRLHPIWVNLVRSISSLHSFRQLLLNPLGFWLRYRFDLFIFDISKSCFRPSNFYIIHPIFAPLLFVHEFQSQPIRLLLLDSRARSLFGLGVIDISLVQNGVFLIIVGIFGFVDEFNDVLLRDAFRLVTEALYTFGVGYRDLLVVGIVI